MYAYARNALRAFNIDYFCQSLSRQGGCNLCFRPLGHGYEICTKYGTNKHRLFLTTKLEGEGVNIRRSQQWLLAGEVVWEGRRGSGWEQEQEWFERRGEGRRNVKGHRLAMPRLKRFGWRLCLLPWIRSYAQQGGGTNKDGVSKDFIMGFSSPLVCRSKWVSLR